MSNTDGDSPQKVSIDNIAAKKHLYTPKQADGSRDWSMEEELSGLEGLLSRIWDKLAYEFMDLNSDPVRKGLSMFIACLIVRNPEHLADTRETHHQMVEFLDSLPKDKNGNPRVGSIEYDGKTEPLDPSGFQEYKNASDDEVHRMFLDSIKHTGWDIANLLLKKRWSMIFSEKPVLITSDKPVAVLNPNDKLRSFGIRTKGTVINFPVSPTRLLTLDDMHEEPPGQYYPLLPGNAGVFNVLTWQNTIRFMVSHRHPDLVCKEMLTTADRIKKEQGIE